MARNFFFLFSFLLLTAFTVSAEQTTGSIHWFENYNQAVEEAQAHDKPLLLLFTGTDWCSWCKKLEGEILDKPEFAKVAGDRFVFVKLDFPLYKQNDPAQTERNKALQAKFGVHAFPTVVILSPDEKKLGSTGYQPNTPQGYAEHLLSFVK